MLTIRIPWDCAACADGLPAALQCCLQEAAQTFVRRFKTQPNGLVLLADQTWFLGPTVEAFEGSQDQENIANAFVVTEEVLWRFAREVPAPIPSVGHVVVAVDANAFSREKNFEKRRRSIEASLMRAALLSTTLPGAEATVIELERWLRGKRPRLNDRSEEALVDLQTDSPWPQRTTPGEDARNNVSRVVANMQQEFGLARQEIRTYSNDPPEELPGITMWPPVLGDRPPRFEPPKVTMSDTLGLFNARATSALPPGIHLFVDRIKKAAEDSRLDHTKLLEQVYLHEYAHALLWSVDAPDQAPTELRMVEIEETWCEMFAFDRLLERGSENPSSSLALERWRRIDEPIAPYSSFNALRSLVSLCGQADVRDLVLMARRTLGVFDEQDDAHIQLVRDLFRFIYEPDAHTDLCMRVEYWASAWRNGWKSPGPSPGIWPIYLWGVR